VGAAAAALSACAEHARAVRSDAMSGTVMIAAPRTIAAACSIAIAT
jgi:hypothetical protein